MNDWIEQQTIFGNDIASKPSKMRSSQDMQSSQDLQAVNNVVQAVNLKRKIVITELTNQLPDDEIADIEKRLDALESFFFNQIERKRNNQDIIDDYIKAISESKGFFDSVVHRLEMLDGPCGMNCEQKLNETNSIKSEFELKASQLKEKIQSLGAKVFEMISNLDAQQVDDQLKSFQRRENDIKKRIDRKIQLLNLTNRNREKLQSEIDQARYFLDDNIEKMDKSFFLGYKPKPIESYLHHLKNLAKDIENKQALVESVNKRIVNIQSELDNKEQQKMKQSINDLYKKENKLMSLIKSGNAKATNGLNNAKRLENNFDIIQSWINDQKAHNESKALVISFAPSAIDFEVQEYKNHLQNIKDFSDGILNTTIDQVTAIREQCDASENEELQKMLDASLAEVQALTFSYNEQLDTIQKVLNKKKEYEQECDLLMDWIKETDTVMSSNIKTSSIQILEDQMLKYEGLLKEAELKGNLMNTIQKKANPLIENLSEVDRLNVTCQLKNLTDKFNLVSLKLNERHNGIVDNIKQLKDAQMQIAEYTQFILSIQQAIRELNKPIGSKTEDVQNLFKNYESILNKLKAKKAEMSLQKISTLPQIKELLSTHDDIIDAIENQLRRLRQLLMLREQFIALVNEVVNFNTKYTDIVSHIERSEDTVEVKIKQYDKIMMKIQECEGTFTSAHDKGMQIASEGTIEDRNNIIEQLQILKHQLQNLKQTIENLRQQHEKAANLYKSFEFDVTKTINVLHEKEAAIKILPVLDVNTESVERELRKQEVLVNEIQKLLNKLQTVLDGIESTDSLPRSIAETVSIGRSLLKSFPKEIVERQKYLDDNKNYRLDYIKLVSEFNNWVDAVENELINENDDIDYENISRIMKKHVLDVDNKLPDIKNLVEKINESAKNISPSLNNLSKEELLRDLQKFAGHFNDIINRAAQSKFYLQKNFDTWKTYGSLLQSIKEFLVTSPKDGPVDSLEKLSEFLLELRNKIETLQVSQQIFLSLTLTNLLTTHEYIFICN